MIVLSGSNPEPQCLSNFQHLERDLGDRDLVASTNYAQVKCDDNTRKGEQAPDTTEGTCYGGHL